MEYPYPFGKGIFISEYYKTSNLRKRALFIFYIDMGFCACTVEGKLAIYREKL